MDGPSSNPASNGLLLNSAWWKLTRTAWPQLGSMQGLRRSSSPSSAPTCSPLPCRPSPGSLARSCACSRPQEGSPASDPLAGHAVASAHRLESRPHRPCPRGGGGRTFDLEARRIGFRKTRQRPRPFLFISDRFDGNPSGWWEVRVRGIQESRVIRNRRGHRWCGAQNINEGSLESTPRSLQEGGSSGKEILASPDYR